MAIGATRCDKLTFFAIKFNINRNTKYILFGFNIKPQLTKYLHETLFQCHPIISVVIRIPGSKQRPYVIRTYQAMHAVLSCRQGFQSFPDHGVDSRHICRVACSTHKTIAMMDYNDEYILSCSPWTAKYQQQQQCTCFIVLFPRQPRYI